MFLRFEAFLELSRSHGWNKGTSASGRIELVVVVLLPMATFFIVLLLLLDLQFSQSLACGGRSETIECYWELTLTSLFERRKARCGWFVSAGKQTNCSSPWSADLRVGSRENVRTARVRERCRESCESNASSMHARRGLARAMPRFAQMYHYYRSRLSLTCRAVSYPRLPNPYLNRHSRLIPRFQVSGTSNWSSSLR